MQVTDSDPVGSPLIGISCGYDLIEQAVRHILAREGFTITITPIKLSVSPRSQPDILVVDDGCVRRHHPYTFVSDLRRHLPNTRLILIDTAPSPERLLRAQQAGISGCLCLIDSLVDRLPGAVRDVAAGGRYLSPTAAALLASLENDIHLIQPRLTAYQRDVLHLMARHWSAAKIATQLGRSRDAIYQVQRILRDLFEVSSNSELVERARQLRMLLETNRPRPQISEP